MSETTEQPLITPQDEAAAQKPAPDPRRAKDVVWALKRAARRDPPADPFMPLARGAFLIWVVILIGLVVSYGQAPQRLYRNSADETAALQTRLENWLGGKRVAQDLKTENPNSQNVVAQQPVGQQPAAEKPTAQQPAAQPPDAQPSAAENPNAQNPAPQSAALPEWLRGAIHYSVGLMGFVLFLLRPLLNVFPHRLGFDPQSAIAVFSLGTLAFAGYYALIYLIGLPLMRGTAATARGLHRFVLKPAWKAAGRAIARARERMAKRQSNTAAGTEPKLQ
jgi:hypothetical protein